MIIVTKHFVSQFAKITNRQRVALLERTYKNLFCILFLHVGGKIVKKSDIPGLLSLADTKLDPTQISGWVFGANTSTGQSQSFNFDDIALCAFRVDCINSADVPPDLPETVGGRVPEPSILAIMGIGLAGFGFARRRGQKS